MCDRAQGSHTRHAACEKSSGDVELCPGWPGGSFRSGELGGDGAAGYAVFAEVLREIGAANNVP